MRCGGCGRRPPCRAPVLSCCLWYQRVEADAGLVKTAIAGGSSTTASTAVSACCSSSTAGASQFGDRIEPGWLYPRRSQGAVRRLSPGGLRLAAEQVKADDLARGMAVKQVAAEGIDFQRNHRARQCGAPANVACRVDDGELTLQGCRGDRAAGKSGTACETVPPR